MVLNIRNQDGFRCRCRLTARTWDGGQSIPARGVTVEAELPDPAVAAGVFSSGGVVFFSNPACQNGREWRGMNRKGRGLRGGGAYTGEGRGLRGAWSEWGRG